MAQPKRDTRFKPGQSGNPRGRTPGSGLSAKLRRAIAADADDIIRAIADQAKAGDVQAAKVLLDRILPAVKPTAEPVRLRELADGGLADKGQALLAAVGAGKVAPDVAAQLMQALGTLARVTEMDDLAARVAALEEKSNEPS